MGCFGYICKGCGTAIIGDCLAGGEDCVLIHVRHGKELGRVEGNYNEYGTVIEEVEQLGRFRGESDVNSADAIFDSCYHENDSYNVVSEKRIYEGNIVGFEQYMRRRMFRKVKGSGIAVFKSFCLMY